MEPDKVPAAQRAYEHTRALLLDNHVQPGEMLSEGAIATSLNVSRTPVREAFTRLQAEGWLRLYPRRGALVLPQDPAQIRDMVDARILLESAALDALALRSVAQRENLVHALEDIINAQDAARQERDLTTFAEHDLAFHRTIIEAAGNSVLLRFHDVVADQERRMSMRSLWRSPEAAERVVRQHRELLTAVGQGETEQFREELRHHLEDIHSTLLS